MKGIYQTLISLEGTGILVLGRGKNYREIMVRLNCDEVDFPAENWELVELLFLNSTHETS